MTISVLLLSDSVTEPKAIQLIKSQRELEFLGCKTFDEASASFIQFSPDVLWLDLNENPNHGLRLLEQMRSSYESTFFIVSMKNSNFAHIKKAYNLGTTDVLIEENWWQDLPGVISALELTNKGRLDFSPSEHS